MAVMIDLSDFDALAEELVSDEGISVILKDDFLLGVKFKQRTNPSPVSPKGEKPHCPLRKKVDSMSYSIQISIFMSTSPSPIWGKLEGGPHAP